MVTDASGAASTTDRLSHKRPFMHDQPSMYIDDYLFLREGGITVVTEASDAASTSCFAPPPRTYRYIQT